MGIIGQNFMEKFQVTIDFGTMKMDLVRQWARYHPNPIRPRHPHG